jgi:hypothetical protein
MGEYSLARLCGVLKTLNKERSSFAKLKKRAGKVAKVVEYLLGKNEALSLNPSTAKKEKRKKKDLVMCCLTIDICSERCQFCLCAYIINNIFTRSDGNSYHTPRLHGIYHHIYSPLLTETWLCSS